MNDIDVQISRLSSMLTLYQKGCGCMCSTLQSKLGGVILGDGRYFKNEISGWLK